MLSRFLLPTLRASCLSAALLLPAAPAFAASEMTARGALSVLPKGSATKLARITAEEGRPEPERWHILVHDPKSESGLREYVVAEGELVADRTVSQFAETLTAEDVVGTKALKIDSDKVADLARRYALANDKVVSSLSYEFAREGAAAAPVWKVRCLDDAGVEVGILVITAGKGNVVSHEGFPIEPREEQPKRNTKNAKSESSPEPPLAIEEPVSDSAQPEASSEEEPDAGSAEREEIAASSPPQRTERSTRSSSASARKSTRSRSIERVPNPATTVRRATAPVRRVIRSVLPF